MKEEVNVGKPRRNPRRRCIDSAANSPAYPTTTDFQERSLSRRGLSRSHAHTTQRFYHLLHLHQLLSSLSLSSISSSSNACVHASAHGRMRADVWAVYAGRRLQKCGEWTSRLSVAHRIRFHFRAPRTPSRFERRWSRLNLCLVNVP